jgi:hypothetical protein
MRLPLVALLIPCLALGGCISRGDGSVLEVLLADDSDPQVSENIIGVTDAVPPGMMAMAPLPAARPPEFGGATLVATASGSDMDEVAAEESEIPSDAEPPHPALEPGVKPKGLGYFAAYASTEVSCFPETLRTSLNLISEHYKKPVEVASGLRRNARKGSMHRHCMAADIRIEGVDPMALATYAKTVPGINGVGSYHSTDLIHVDMREEQFAWRH